LELAGKLLLYCGRLSPEKYPQDVLLSFRVLAYRREDVYLLLVGDGPEREELKELARKNGLGERVRFLGYRDNYFLKDLFISADVIVCPLAGSVLIEAALAQLPIVAYDLEWHSELVIDRYSGMLVPFKDIQGLADATAFLLDRPEEAENFGRRAREIAFQLFHPDIIMEKEKTIYCKLLGPHNQPC
jgi:glycosyltransferase involved in cell wall biosynthesis